MSTLEKSKTNRSVFPDGSSIPAKTGVSGIVKVHESVIAAIIRKAACSVTGVVRLAGNSLVDNIAEIVGSQKVRDRVISIEMGDNEVVIEVKIIAAYGEFLPALARNVQDTVTHEINRITGMQVPRIDVIIADVEETADDEEEEPENESEDH